MFAELIGPGIEGTVAPMGTCYRGLQPDGWCFNTGGVPTTGGCKGGMLPEGGPCVYGGIITGA